MKKNASLMTSNVDNADASNKNIDRTRSSQEKALVSKEAAQKIKLLKEEIAGLRSSDTREKQKEHLHSNEQQEIQHIVASLEKAYDSQEKKKDEQTNFKKVEKIVSTYQVPLSQSELEDIQKLDRDQDVKEEFEKNYRDVKNDVNNLWNSIKSLWGSR